MAGADQRTFIDIDSLLRPVYGYAKRGASFGHTKVSGKQVLRKGLSPLATTISTPIAAPVVAGMGVRAGKAGSGKGAASMVTDAIGTARAATPDCEVLVRGDSAFGNSLVINAAINGGARFSMVINKDAGVTWAIAAISQDAWTPVRYPGAVTDPDTGELISDAQVAETSYTAFPSTNNPVTARLIVRRVRDRKNHDALFPVWRYHPFFTKNTELTAAADITHRGHAIIETVFSDLIDGPLAHLPLGVFRCELGLGDLRSDGAQPGASRGNTDRSTPRARPGRGLTTPAGQRARTTGQTPTPTHPTTPRALALDRSMARAVEQHLPHHTRTTRDRVTQPNRHTGLTEPEKLDRPPAHPRAGKVS